MILRLRWFAFMLPLVGACSGGTAEESTAAIQSAVGSPMVGAVKSPVSGATGATSCTMSRGSSSGPLIVNPAISLVFWGSYWNQSGGTSDRVGYDTAWSVVGNSAGFYNRMKEYGIGQGTYSGASVQNTALANNTTLSETSIQNALAAEINAGALPAVTANTTYVIMLPPTVASQTDVSNGFAGHHGFFVNSSRNIYYAVIEYNSDHNYNNPVISHEISEAATDPDTSTGYRNATGDEIGDVCRFQPLPGGYDQLAGFQVETIWAQSLCRCVATRDVRSGDFDGDWKADVAVWRPSDHTWYIRYSSGITPPAVAHGNAGDVPVAADYDGDGKVDIAVWRPSDHTWYIRYSSGITPPAVTHGNTGDVPVVADYDGDGKADIAVWRSSDHTWYIRYSTGITPPAVAHGNLSDVPVPADYDGDGKADIAVWRPSDHTWYIRYSTGITPPAVTHGNPGDLAVPADYDGDGKADIAVWRPSDHTWYIRYSSGITPPAVTHGNAGDIPVVADYDGDSLADIAVWRPSDHTWYIRYSSGITPPAVTQGNAGDIVFVSTQADQGCTVSIGSHGSCNQYCIDVGAPHGGYCPYSDADGSYPAVACACNP